MANAIGYAFGVIMAVLLLATVALYLAASTVNALTHFRRSVRRHLIERRGE